MDELREDVSLKNRKKIPNNIKLKRNAVIFKNLVISIAIVIYFYLINLGFYNIKHSIYLTDLKVFSASLLLLSIIFFEKGYNKDSESLFLSGVEILFIAIITLTEQYRVFNENSYTIQFFYSIAFIFFIFYYIIKSLIQTRMLEKDYNASDARELVN